MLVVSALVAVLGSCTGDRLGDELNLEQRAVHHLPANGFVSAVSTSSDGKLVLMLTDGVYSLVNGAGRSRPYPIGVQPIGVGWSSEGDVEILDRRDRLWTENEGHYKGRAFHVPPYALQAMRQASGWLVLTIDSAKANYGLHFSNGRTARRIASLPVVASALRADGRFILVPASGNQAAMLIQREHPYTAIEVDTATVLAEYNVPLVPTDTLGMWITASTVRIGGKLVHTVSDLRSERRKLVSTVGDSTTVVNLPVPLSLVATHNQSYSVYGLLGLDGTRLVEYDVRNAHF